MIETTDDAWAERLQVEVRPSQGLGRTLNPDFNFDGIDGLPHPADVHVRQRRIELWQLGCC